MPVDLTIAGAMGLKAVAAAKAASAASKQAAAQAIAMAQNTNLAALQAEQAQANLEKYVYGVPVSSVPPSVAPMPPAALHPFPMKAMSVGPVPLVPFDMQPMQIRSDPDLKLLRREKRFLRKDLSNFL
eukprot:TRINITY_DN16303_c0_g3_i1.p2 TRINITY_DN16303_c0_g3~~TRINITY_DN16303_c0_g3_i1.p2  ORF type:complete len:128 (+),score=36.39 TRINITY_DN16303_c0_g3_i1:121-504(+)